MRWPPFRHVFFDCDSTLTAIEGIDVLAEQAGKAAEVGALTDAAMAGHVDLGDVYTERLKAINPTRRQVIALRQAYKNHTVADAAETIAVLGDLGVEVYVISGGLIEPVREFAVSLGVAAERVAAVDVRYDVLAGDWWRRASGKGLDDPYLSHDSGDLTVGEGKADVIRRLLDGAPGRVMLIGDGMTDLIGGEAADLFVAFSGVAARPEVVAGAPVELTVPSLAPVIPLAVGPGRVWDAEPAGGTVARRAFDLVATGALNFRDQVLGAKFAAALAAATTR